MFIFESPERTLKDTEVDEGMKKLQELLKKEFSIEIR